MVFHDIYSFHFYLLLYNDFITLIIPLTITISCNHAILARHSNSIQYPKQQIPISDHRVTLIKYDSCKYSHVT